MRRSLISVVAGLSLLGAVIVAYIIASPDDATGPPGYKPPPVPDDWLTFEDPHGLYSIQYPPNWTADHSESERQVGAQFSPPIPANWKRSSRPPDHIVVEVNIYEAVGSSGCGGALSIDPQTGAGTPTEIATRGSLSGLPAWQILRLQGDPSISEEDLTRIQAVSLIYKGYCFIVAGYFTQQVPDVETYRLVAASFKFEFEF